VTDRNASGRDKALRDRVSRAEGQIRGIGRMLEEGRSCDEVVTQLLAARAAIERIAAEVVTTHIDECLATLLPDEARATVSRAIKTLAQLD
jgi:CsoR family transcriptional regulator, copper-sensing transcriptional repressor